jgi:hypothetical protein
MADLAPAVGGLLELVGPVIGPVIKRALAAFLTTTAGMAALGLGALVSAWLLVDAEPWWERPLAGALSLAVFVGLGVFLAMKRSIGTALVHALGELGLGRRLVGGLFRQILGVTDEGSHGDRGVAAARAAERVPLAQAEQRLRGAVERLLSAPSEGGGLGGWLRRKVEGALVERIELLTLARFREASAAEGGVDLLRVRDELVQQADALAADQVRGALTRVTVLVVLGAGVVVVLLVQGLRAW